MINIETIEFIKLCDFLAELSKNGIEPFGNATQDTFRSKIFYDDRCADDAGYYKVVLDACIVDDPACFHHDIISYYDSTSKEYTVHVAFNEDDPVPYVLIRLTTSEKEIIIDEGVWYFV